MLDSLTLREFLEEGIVDLCDTINSKRKLLEISRGNLSWLECLTCFGEYNTLCLDESFTRDKVLEPLALRGNNPLETLEIPFSLVDQLRSESLKDLKVERLVTDISSAQELNSLMILENVTVKEIRPILPSNPDGAFELARALRLLLSDDSVVISLQRYGQDDIWKLVEQVQAQEKTEPQELIGTPSEWVGKVLQFVEDISAIIEDNRLKGFLSEEAYDDMAASLEMSIGRAINTQREVRNYANSLALRNWLIADNSIVPLNTSWRRCMSIAGLFEDNFAYEKAIEWYLKAIPLAIEAMGAEHPYTATTYNNIAVVYSDQGEYARALEQYGKALAIRERVLGIGHPDIASLCHVIGVLNTITGDCNMALEWLCRALSIREKRLGPNHPDTAKTCDVAMMASKAKESALQPKLRDSAVHTICSSNREEGKAHKRPQNE